MKIMFADEKKFKGEGFMGQVWVRRPPGEGDNPEYSVSAGMLHGPAKCLSPMYACKRRLLRRRRSGIDDRNDEIA